jgi:uncharacterized membrane protein
MSDRRLDWVMGAAVVAMGLIAGLYYAYACSVMPGLGDTDDRTFVDAMQQINEAIQNPVFFLTFVGAPLLVIWAMVVARRSSSAEVLRWLAIALVLYAVGFVITGALNIPLNNDLEDAGDPARIADLAAVRDDFEGPWVAWNIVRTVATVASFGALMPAVLAHARRRVAG